MPTECSADLLGFARVEGRLVVAAFDGGKITSDAGGLLLGAAERAIGLVERFARCFTDSRSAELVEHTVSTMVGQRIFGIALGYRHHRPVWPLHGADPQDARRSGGRPHRARPHTPPLDRAHLWRAALVVPMPADRP